MQLRRPLESPRISGRRLALEALFADRVFTQAIANGQTDPLWYVGGDGWGLKGLHALLQAMSKVTVKM